MKLKLRKIGNSYGVIFPKEDIEEFIETGEIDVFIGDFLIQRELVDNAFTAARHFYFHARDSIEDKLAEDILELLGYVDKLKS